MKIYLASQTKRLQWHLKQLKTLPVKKYEKELLSQKTSTIIIQRPFAALEASPLFDYKIFPGHIMESLTEWSLEKRVMRAGDLIVQQVYLPPHPVFSQKIIFGVKINHVLDEPTKKEFSYQTLEGHVEKGISTFTLEAQRNYSTFSIHTYSQPDGFIAYLLAGVFSIPYQAYCTEQALKNMKRQLENPGVS